jgi:hypothetical protein
MEQPGRPERLQFLRIKNQAHQDVYKFKFWRPSVGAKMMGLCRDFPSGSLVDPAVRQLAPECHLESRLSSASVCARCLRGKYYMSEHSHPKIIFFPSFCPIFHREEVLMWKGALICVSAAPYFHMLPISYYSRMDSLLCLSTKRVRITYDTNPVNRRNKWVGAMLRCHIYHKLTTEYDYTRWPFHL